MTCHTHAHVHADADVLEDVMVKQHRAFRDRDLATPPQSAAIHALVTGMLPFAT